MSSSSKYSGLAGTILLGTLLGLNYTQYAKRKRPLSDKGAAYNPADDVPSGALYDREGKIVPLGKTNLPGMDTIRQYRSFIPSDTILVLCGALSAVWVARSFVAMNKVLTSRYSDVVYQIRRPDVIANRLLAWKYLGVGGLVVPVIGAAAVYALWSGHVVIPSTAVGGSVSVLSDQVYRTGLLSVLNQGRGPFSDSVTEFSKILKDGFRP